MSALRDVRGKVRAFRESILWRLVQRQRGWFVAMMLTAFVTTGIAAGSAMTIRSLVDDAVIARTRPLDEFVGALMTLAVLGLVAGWGFRQIASRIGYHLEFELRIWLHDRLLASDPTRLDAVASGQMVTRAMTDLLLLELLVVALPGLATVVLVLLGLGAILASIHPTLSLLVFAMLPANIAIAVRIRRKLWSMSWVVLDRRARVTTAIDESVRGARVVKAFGREEHERRRVADAARAAYAVALSRVRLVARYDVLLALVPGTTMAALAWLGVREGIAGTISVGDLLLFFVFSVVFANLARGFGGIQSAWQFAKTGAGRIFELIAFAVPATPGTGVPLPPDGDGVRLDHAEVRIAGHQVLADVSFAARPGELVVIAGPPRSGKTTLAEVLAGRRRPAAGSVTIDGVPIADVDPTELRREVLVCPEHPFVFGRSVRENLLLGAPEGTSDDALWPALKAAQASDVVAGLPQGLDTVLGDRGLTLSGGQRQRLALARAIVLPPRVLVLDDALSAVDPAAEMAILRRVREFAPETVVVAITRRPSAAAVADRVVHLPEPGPGAPRRPRAAGSLAVDGPYNLLLAANVSRLPAPRDEPRAGEQAVDEEAPPTITGLLRPHARLTALASVFLLLSTLSTLVPTWMTQVAIDSVEEGRAAGGTVAAVATLAAGVAVAFLTYGFRVHAKQVEEGAGYVLRRSVFGRLMRLGIDFYDRELPGRIAARVVHDLDQISAFLDTGVYDLVTAVALLVASFTVIAVWEPSVALAISAALPIIALLTALQLRPADRAYREGRRALGVVVTRLQEDFAGRHVIEAMGAENRTRKAFVQAAFELRTARRRAALIANTYVETTQFVGVVAGVVLLNKAATRVFEGGLSVGGMVALSLFLAAALAPIPSMAAVLQRYLAARASFRTLREPFSAPVVPEVGDDGADCPGADGDITFDDVDFTYPGTTREVLHAVSLNIPAGTTVAVVGRTGSGKSSIAKLLARVYDPDAGRVTIGGTDIRQWDLTSFRRRIGIVPQDAFCFRGTVAENIAYGRPDATREEIKAAAEAVGAYDAVLGLVGGLDARVEEEGRNLTAAQVQLIALARAWLTDPDLLILDEATSSLDEAAERFVLAATKATEKTAVMITHRLQVAKAADLVVVIDDGRVAEVGKPATLRRRKGAYARLWESGPDVSDQGPVAAPTVPRGSSPSRPPVADHPIVTRSLEDIRSGALGGGQASTAAQNGTGEPRRTPDQLVGEIVGDTDEEVAAFVAAAGGAEAVATALLEPLRAALDPSATDGTSLAFVVRHGDTAHRLEMGPPASPTSDGVAGKNELTLELQATDLVRIAFGSLEMVDAIVTGRVVVHGDLSKLVALGDVFASAGAA